MNTIRKELMACLLLAGVLLMGYALSALLGHFIIRPAAKGVGFFTVSLLSYFILWKRRRVGVFAGIGLSILAGFLFVVGELLWPHH